MRHKCRAPWHRVRMCLSRQPRFWPPPRRKKSTLLAPGCFCERSILLRSEDCILGRFGNAELDHPLGGNLNLFAGRWIASEPRGAIHQDELAQAWEGKGIFGVFVSQFSDLVEYLSSLFLGDAALISDRSRDLGFRE